MNHYVIDHSGSLRSIAQNTSYDAFAPALNPQQWEMLAGYLQPFDLAAGQVLIDQGANDRTLFFIESGALSVHMIGDTGQMRWPSSTPARWSARALFLPAAALRQRVATGAARVWRLTPSASRRCRTASPTWRWS